MGCEIQRSRARAFDGGQPGAGSVLVRPIRPADADAWRLMREALWPDDRGGHADEIRRFFADSSSSRDSVLVAESSGALVGFVELSLRAYAEGCETSPVAYLEGWFVSDQARSAGVGRALLRAAEEWGRANGCTEFASDAEAENAASADAHRACGFEDAGLIRCFRKRL
jgi:aminoglycoside 6'-N-acetyltransferase I